MAKTIYMRRSRAITAELSLKMSRLYWDAMRKHGGPAALEAIYIMQAVGIGHMRGRPVSLARIAIITGIPRSTIQRRLKELIDCGFVVRSGKVFCISDKLLAEPITDRSKLEGMIIRAGEELKSAQNGRR